LPRTFALARPVPDGTGRASKNYAGSYKPFIRIYCNKRDCLKQSLKNGF
jgi:hypothetical protein